MNRKINVDGKSMIIRKAMMNDLDEIVELYSSTIGRCKGVRKNMRRHIRKNQVRVIQNVNVIGAYIWVVNRLRSPYSKRFTATKYTWLEHIMVSPNMQGYGYSRILMEDFLERTGNEFRLLCDKELITFYERWDFTVDCEVNTRGTTQVIMFRN